jgi:hypothetical protein
MKQRGEPAMAATAAERQKTYEVKKAADGYRRICMWVREEKVEQLRAYAKKLEK